MSDKYKDAIRLGISASVFFMLAQLIAVAFHFVNNKMMLLGQMGVVLLSFILYFAGMITMADNFEKGADYH
jgi:uncharacterized membrane protein